MLSFFTLALTATVGGLPNLLPATEEKQGSAGKPTSQRPEPTLSAGLRVEFAADLGAASLAVTRGNIGIESPLPPLGEWRFGADLASEWSWYDFDDLPAAAGGLTSPLAHGQSSLLGLSLVRPLGDGWTFVGRPVIAFSGDTEAEVGDSVLFGGFVTIGRRITDALSLSVGVYAAEQFEEDAVVFPIAGIQWQIDEQTRLASRGPGLRLTRGLGEGWQAFLEGTYRPRDYRLAEDSSVPGGALSDDSIPVSLGAEWQPRPAFQFSIQVGALLARSVELRDDSGDSVFEENPDASAFLGFGVRIGL